MNRRITKTMAYEAASTMKKGAYSTMIEKAYEKLNTAGEQLVRKYIPAPVIGCVNEYSDYFAYTTTGAGIATIKKHSDGWQGCETRIPVKLSFTVPNGSNYVTVEKDEYDMLRKLHCKVKQLERDCEAFGEQVYEALIALKTEKAVEKELPEAMKYLVFPEVKAVPAPVFTGLREIIKKIKPE